MSTAAGMAPARECVLLSYDEPRAERHHRRLIGVFGAVKRLHGVRGMGRAYRLCAELVDTEEFFLADADLAIDTSFDPGTVTPLPAGVPMRVWRTRNPVNGLVYGYGGLKLCRRSAFRHLGRVPSAVDVLAGLPGRPEFVPAVAGDTAFDASPRHTWRAGFRECAMLTRGCDYRRVRSEEAEHRLHAWQHIGHGPFGAWARQGAADGIAFAQWARDNSTVWALLNDPQWLDEHFAQLGHAVPGG
ncbi:MAG: hypothetical protein JO115_20140 [Pseudonocardiales bacterium]|nr:hypothetical protein [Pseudonocardiales bacterium]